MINDDKEGGNAGGVGKGWRWVVENAQNKSVNRGVIGILGYFGLWMFLTSVLAWPVARGVEGVAPGIFPFARIFGRVELVVALVLAVGLLRWWGEDPRRWVDGKKWKGELGRGGLWSGVGLAMVGVVALVQVVLGVMGWGGRPGVGVWAGAIGTGLLVGVLEEYFFRGVLGLAWWRAVGERKAGLVVLVGAMIFAGAHFIRPRVGWDGGDGWRAGFLAWGSLELWSGTGHLWKLAGLVLIGLILARLVWNEQSLAGAIGLHAGWVGGLRWVESACPPVPQAVEGWWGPSLEAGPLPFLLLLIVTLALWGRPIRASLG